MGAAPANVLFIRQPDDNIRMVVVQRGLARRDNRTGPSQSGSTATGRVTWAPDTKDTKRVVKRHWCTAAHLHVALHDVHRRDSHVREAARHNAAHQKPSINGT